MVAPVRRRWGTSADVSRIDDRDAEPYRPVDKSSRGYPEHLHRVRPEPDEPGDGPVSPRQIGTRRGSAGEIRPCFPPLWSSKGSSWHGPTTTRLQRPEYGPGLHF